MSSRFGGGMVGNLFPLASNHSGLHVGHVCQCSHLQSVMFYPSRLPANPSLNSDAGDEAARAG